MDNIRQFLEIASAFVVPLMIVAFPLYGLFKKVAVYDEFVTGAKEGFTTAIAIMPYLIAILVAIGMFRASGAMDWITDELRPALSAVGFPPDLLPIAVFRP